jgi:hypothetical protein
MMPAHGTAHGRRNDRVVHVARIQTVSPARPATLLRGEQKRDSTMAFSPSMDGQLIVVIPQVYLDNSRLGDG